MSNDRCPNETAGISYNDYNMIFFVNFHIINLRVLKSIKVRMCVNILVLYQINFVKIEMNRILTWVENKISHKT